MLLRSLKLTNLLSFGPDSEAVELGPLNVLIGPNGSGKSNFIEAIGLLKAAPKDLAQPFRTGGGVGAWIWQGEQHDAAMLEAVLGSPYSSVHVRHRLAFRDVDQHFILVHERLEDVDSPADAHFYYDPPVATLYVEGKGKPLTRFDARQSVLSQVRDPDQYPALAFAGDEYEQIRLYREWSFGRNAAPRRPQPADLPTDHLMEGAQNLGLILNKFRRDVPTKKALIEALKLVFEGITDFSVQVEGGTVQIFLEEEHWTIPATRLSDGTIRWLALLAVLLDPNPPPLVCIEEPELGLHPDLMNHLARLLKDASERMQLVVTTHSEALVDAFTDTPEAVLVCERHEGSTTMRRLERDRLAEWLKTYSLNQLWSKGEIGGTRW
ncbi:AAA family ATPase [Polyangium aurulentum]|uniref:AAA family ATPase n=1 Tax=Polyangium aurulentum TaxID=2567896 RepID=UPI0010AE2AA8|nr:AAA family ATPase [Polyangium aurulentum]UQA59137.1 AAA family ATPase [Polyangium aurulentum]